MSLETFHNLPPMKQQQIIEKGIDVFTQVSYSEASTDIITKEAGISKGLLFHYFGSKKNFYLYLLEYCIKLLSATGRNEPEDSCQTFYELLFFSMDIKMKVNLEHPKEVMFVNQAAKETNQQIAEEKQNIISKYMLEIQTKSAQTFQMAVNKLTLRNDVEKEKLVKGLSMYINTIILQYLQIYKDRPLGFFQDSEKIKIEIKSYIDLILHGVEEKND